MQTTKKICVLGLMSGTSMDGLDLAMCEFTEIDQKWTYQILEASTEPYPNEWLDIFISLPTASAEKWVCADQDFGRLIGIYCNGFIQKTKITPHLIASHGQTIFHQPDQRFTGQIGHGAAISAQTRLPVVSDFRTMDVALSGQGAPLVPIGDKILFEDYDFCLNLGGIANISCDQNGKRIAFDICPTNLVLNYLANKIGLPYDSSGKIARSGKLNNALLDKLNSLGFYSLDFPKSLGREWVEKEILPMLSLNNSSVPDQLATFIEHCAFQLSETIRSFTLKNTTSRLLITGGGAHNTFLIERLAFYLGENPKIIIPDKMTIDYKEALIFAFLGLLRLTNKLNSLKSVTGAYEDNIGGALFGDFSQAYSMISEK